VPVLLLLPLVLVVTAANAAACVGLAAGAVVSLPWLLQLVLPVLLLLPLVLAVTAANVAACVGLAECVYCWRRRCVVCRPETIGGRP
jgi:hypothetical protein